MREFVNCCREKVPWNSIGRCIVSLVSVLLAQFSLFFVCFYFHTTSSLLALLSLSALTLLIAAGFGRCMKSLLGVRASAPAFVFFSIWFIWSTYFALIRHVISPLLDIFFNVELVMLLIGLCRILLSDPGFVAHKSSCFEKLVSYPPSEAEAHAEELEASACKMQEESPIEKSSFSGQRVRYCRHCKTHVKGFDHHCPAFGNCIGRKNHVLFIILLVGFVVSEASYILCSSQFLTKSQRLDHKDWMERNLSGHLAVSTILFCYLQIAWQVAFLAWHIHCICLNIKTDEWINWKRYPEFQLVVQPQPGLPVTAMRFTNPYNKGVLRNLKEFVMEKG